MYSDLHSGRTKELRLPWRFIYCQQSLSLSNGIILGLKTLVPFLDDMIK